MAIYKVQGPDGVMHELDGPEGATDEQIIAAAEEAFGQQPSTEPLVANAEGEPPTDANGMVTGTHEQQMEWQRSGQNAFSANPLGQRLLQNTETAAAGAGLPEMGALAATGLVAGGKTLSNATGLTKYLSNKFKGLARSKAIESLNPTTANKWQLEEALGGEAGTNKAADYLLDEVITPNATVRDIDNRLAGLSDRAGRHIGEWRDTADLRSLEQGVQRPRALDIEKAVRDELAGKYGVGAEAGQATQLDNAIAEINKVSPVEYASVGDEVAQSVDDIGGSVDDAYAATRANIEEASLPPREGVPVGFQRGQTFTPGAPIPKEVGQTAPEMTEGFLLADGTKSGFPYLHDQPTFTELAQTATRLNDAAKNARQINQADGALADAANILSRKSTEGIDDVLTAAERPEFAAAKEEFQITKSLEGITDRSKFREPGTGQLPVSHYAWYNRAFQTVMPLAKQATMANKIAKALQANPQAFGRNTEVLTRAMKSGPAALNSTIYMLQQQDAEFKRQFEEMNGSAE